MAVTPSASPPLSAQLEGWYGGTAEGVDDLDPRAGAALRDLLGADAGTSSHLGPLFHWVYFQSWAPLSSLGPDGHPRATELMPPLRERRRMFAGGRCTFYAPLAFGVPASATTTLVKQEIKGGRTGELLFLTERTEIVQGGSLRVTDEQDIVYRSGPPRAVVAAPADAKAEQAAPSQRRVSFDPLTLFRFSALTANSHRIHYDADYARAVEGYAGLVVQGPLLVLTMAAELAGNDVHTLTYRLHRPVFSGECVDVAIDEDREAVRVTITGPDGELRASATARLREPAAVS